MKGESPRGDQPSYMIQGLKEMCNPRDALFQIADMIPWDQVESWFEDKYAIELVSTTINDQATQKYLATTCIDRWPEARSIIVRPVSQQSGFFPQDRQ